MTTREALAALSDSELDERVATTLMGWEQVTTVPYPVGEKPPAQHTWWLGLDGGYIQRLPGYSRNMHVAWRVVERIMRIPESEAEAEIAPNTRFLYAFERAAHTLVCSSEPEAARWICEQALLAWESGPLFPKEEEKP